MGAPKENSIGRADVNPNDGRDERLSKHYGEDAFNQFSDLTKGKLNDLGLKRRYEQQESDLSRLNALSNYDQKVASFSFLMSSIETFGARLIMTFASDKEVNNLVDALHKGEKVARNILYNSQIDKNGSEINAAKTEAALKGFVFPTKFAGPADDLKTFELSKNEMEKAFLAVEKALVIVSDKKIPKTEYANKLQKEYIEIIKKDNPSLQDDKIKAFKEFVKQGVKSPQDKNISDEERKVLTAAANTSCKELGEIFAKNEAIITDNEKILRKEAVTKYNETVKQKVVSKLLSNFESKGSQISPETKVKLNDIVSQISTKLGHDFVDKNMDKIVGTIDKEVNKNKTLLSNFVSNLKISSTSIQKIVNNAAKPFDKDAAAHVLIMADKAYKEIMSDREKFNKNEQKIINSAISMGDVMLNGKAKDIGLHIKSQHLKVDTQETKTPQFEKQVNAHEKANEKNVPTNIEAKNTIRPQDLIPPPSLVTPPLDRKTPVQRRGGGIQIR